jgi:hypothetical protein
MLANAPYTPHAPLAYVATARCSWLLPTPEPASVPTVEVTATDVPLVMAFEYVTLPPLGAVVSAVTVNVEVALLPALSNAVTVCRPGLAAPVAHE